MTGEDGELVLDVSRPGGSRVLVVVRFGGAGVLEAPGVEDPGPPVGPWRVILTTEDRGLAPDPRPPRVEPGTPHPRVAFRRAGAAVLTTGGRGPGPGRGRLRTR